MCAAAQRQERCVECRWTQTTLAAAGGGLLHDQAVLFRPNPAEITPRCPKGYPYSLSERTELCSVRRLEYRTKRRIDALSCSEMNFAGPTTVVATFSGRLRHIPPKAWPALQSRHPERLQTQIEPFRAIQP